MSNAEEEADEVCANCGKAEVDDVKLKKCNACKLVKYCSVDCQKNHRPQHKKACKKRATEIRDDELFAQPDVSCYGECPICCLPLSLDKTKSSMNSCCCKLICNGCVLANVLRERGQGLAMRCAFCREPVQGSQEKADEHEMKRAEANDPVGLFQVGARYKDEGNYEGAFKYFTKAATLGEADALTIYIFCIVMEKVLRRTRKRKSTIWKRQPLVVIT